MASYSHQETQSSPAKEIPRAGQKLTASSTGGAASTGGSPHRRRRAPEDESVTPGGFCAALQRGPPPAPPALLRRLGTKEITGVGKVKVMLRVASPPDAETASGAQLFTLERRKRQATLHEPPAAAPPAPDDRRVGVAAPKMFAFDAVFSGEDSQTEICAGALTDVIHAVINGTDGCLFCFGHAGLGKTYTMLGSPASASTLGAVPCAIAWLFRGIGERRARAGTRFSVRVSAVEVCPHTNQLRDLLAPYATDTEQSPGVYLRDDPLFGTQLQNQSELRVHNAQKAAFYLDAALATRGPAKDEGKDSHLLYTLHVYQYSVGGKGAVAGGRSRLHLIDLGNSERGKSSGGIPLSGIGNILLAIFNGQKHLPYRDHNLTHVLRECLGSLTCHTAMIVHVSPKDQHYTETLTTLQLASRIHRLRRRKIKFTPVNNTGSGGSSGEDAPKAPSSSEPDPSSSDLSADTVIYVGPTDDATDGEHPPVYIPNMNSGDNRCAMSKALRGSGVEHRQNKTPLAKVVEERSPVHKASSSVKSSPVKANILTSSVNTPKSSPSHSNSKIALRKNSAKGVVSEEIKCKSPLYQNTNAASASDEQWIDGPRISKSKLVEARHIMKEVHHVKKRETWIDGPMQLNKVPLQAGVLNTGNESVGYGYMDSHKKSMIRKWVENQTSQMQKTKHVSPNHRPQSNTLKELTQFKTCDDSDNNKLEPLYKEVIKPTQVEESIIRTGLKASSKPSGICEEESEYDHKNNAKDGLSMIGGDFNYRGPIKNDDEDEDSEELAEIPPALPLIQPLSSREVSMESLDSRLKERLRMNDELLSNHSRDIDINGMSKGPSEDDDDILEIIEVEEPLEPVPMQDSCLQVTEEDIAYCMGYGENPLPEVDQGNEEHPLRILSQENLTVVSTFTDSLSVYSDMERQIQSNAYLQRALNLYCDDYRDCTRLSNLEVNETRCEVTNKKFEELARLHEHYQSRLNMANVSCVRPYREMSQPNLKSSPSQFQSLSNVYDVDDFHGNSSIYSEPPYKPLEQFCESCKQSLSRPGSATNWHDYYSQSTHDLHINIGKESFNDNFQLCNQATKDLRIASLRHPDGASNPNLKEEKRIPGNGASSDHEDIYDESKKNSLHLEVRSIAGESAERPKQPPSLPPLPITKEPSTDRLNHRLMSISSGMGSTKITNHPDGYDSGHDSTPRTSKHSPAAISRRAESGYDSVVRDSESSSIDSYTVRKSHRPHGHGAVAENKYVSNTRGLRRFFNRKIFQLASGCASK